jgi:hypothetical protein
LSARETVDTASPVCLATSLIVARIALSYLLWNNIETFPQIKTIIKYFFQTGKSLESFKPIQIFPQGRKGFPGI